MVPLTVNPSGQLEKHLPLCEYRPSLHFVQKFRLKHASQFSILHSKMKKDIKSYIIILSRPIVNYVQVVHHLVVVALTVSYPKSSPFKNVKTLKWLHHTSVSLQACRLWSNIQTASNWTEIVDFGRMKTMKQILFPHS